MQTLAGKEHVALAALRRQRSHVLFVLSRAREGQEAEFLHWYQGTYREGVEKSEGVLRTRHYEQHPVDVGRGQYPLLPFPYLGVYGLSIDGAEQADRLIGEISALHRAQAAARDSATWLYYPLSEKVGRSPVMDPSMLTIAFANAVPGQEDDFREWYATRHIRHALQIPALVSGQCFARTQFQRPGALDAGFSMIAVYEQEGTPEEIVESFKSLPQGALDFPMMDMSRFAESVYRPL